MRYVALMIVVVALFSACSSSSNTNKGPTAAQKKATACSSQDATRAYGVLLKDQSDFDAQVKAANLAQMRALQTAFSVATVPVCATTAANALDKYMLDNVQRLSGTPSGALTSDLDLNSTILQNELAIMAAAENKKQ